jgi:uncharacterized protein
MTNIEAMLALNADHEVETSPLDAAALHHMLSEAFHVEAARDGTDGFLISFDQDADYASDNFHWFVDRFDRFVYIDRIIVAASARGQGLARSFYQNLFAAAKAVGHSRVMCEINVEPPNPGSLLFHRALGFVEIGQGHFPTSGKIVSYQECRI